MKENICLRKGHFIIIIFAFIIMTFIYSMNNDKFNKNTYKLHHRIRKLNDKLDFRNKKYKIKLTKIIKNYNKKNNDNLNVNMILKKERNKMKKLLKKNRINNEKIRSNYRKKLNHEKRLNLKRRLNRKKRFNQKRIDNRFIMSRDKKVIHDPIFPPHKRLPRHIYRNNVYSHFNIPSRGYPDNFQILGILTRNSDEKSLQLFGRQKYPGSRTYEYFVTGNDSNGLQTKLPLKTSNDKEIYDNDVIDIPQLNSSKGKFKVSLYDLNAPVYNPNIL
jgi:hypothetical protein